MRSITPRTWLLLACWAVVVSAFYGLGAGQISAVPISACAQVCLCKNCPSYEAVGAAPGGPYTYWKQNPDYTYSNTTQAVASCQTTQTCDDPSISQTTATIYYTEQASDRYCDPPTPPQGQTVYVQTYISFFPLILTTPHPKPDPSALRHDAVGSVGAPGWLRPLCSRRYSGPWYEGGARRAANLRGASQAFLFLSCQGSSFRSGG
jgi:hypothetical protein